MKMSVGWKGTFVFSPLILHMGHLGTDARHVFTLIFHEVFGKALGSEIAAHLLLASGYTPSTP